MSGITPADAAVAARSFPRRWRALFARAAGDGEHTDVLERSGAEALCRQASEALGATMRQLPPTTVVSPSPAGDALDGLETAATTLAAAIEQVQPDDWTTAAVDALATGIDEAAALLRQADRAIEAALAA